MDLQAAVGSYTPPRPPYSPVTPVLSDSSLLRLESDALQPLSDPGSAPLAFDSGDALSLQNQRHTFARQTGPCYSPEACDARLIMQIEPKSRAVSPSQNPDVLALRSALSILQLQRRQSEADLTALALLKKAALEEPDLFLDWLDKSTQHESDISSNTNQARSQTSRLYNHNHANLSQSTNTSDTTGPDCERTAFLTSQPHPERLPQPQNIIRMPKINWHKYHVAGGSLERLHTESRLRPLLGNPRTDLCSLVQPTVPNGQAAFASKLPQLDSNEDEAIIESQQSLALAEEADCNYGHQQWKARDPSQA